MQSLTFQTRYLLLAGLLLLVPGCGPKERLTPIYPPSADLQREQKPLLRPSDLGSEAALDAHDIAVEAWGERGWNAVGRLCLFFQSHSMPIDCVPKPPGVP